MDAGRKTAVIKDLRERIRRLERIENSRRPAATSALPFGIPALDGLWPEGGLPLAALHEINGLGPSGFAAATAFAAALAGRRQQAVLWCTTRADFYAPGLAQVGLPHTRLVIVRARSGQEVLAAMEEGLRHAAVGCVIGETARLDLTASRRLQLAAETGGTLALALRRPRSLETLAPIAAATRWHVRALPSAPHAVPQAGQARWSITLLRARSGGTGEWSVEVPDAQGYMRLSSPLDDRNAATPHATGQRAVA